MMTEDESTIQIGIMAAADSLYFGFGEDAEAGVGSGLLPPPLLLLLLERSVLRSASDFTPLTKWAVDWMSTVSLERRPFSRNFSVAIAGGRGRERRGGGGGKER
jgi:hypothetical protein